MLIGKISKITGISRDAIRLYEKMGLITSQASKNPTNTYREYDQKCLERVKAIQNMKEVSITLKEAKHLFDAMSGGTFSAEFRKDFVRKKISEIDQKIAKLETFKKTIIDMGKPGCAEKNAAIVEKMK